MHNEFKKLLKCSEGSSEQVITVFVDIRGFSKFSQVTESPDTAMYVKRAFLNILDGYFPYAKFFKSIGDGLLIIVPFNERILHSICNKVVRSSVECHERFNTICDDDPIINFSTPDKIGIGISRGTACKLSSRGKTLDYSGRLLNLTSRLMNLARPSGIVIDGDFKIELLEPALAQQFEQKAAYLRGIAEDVPREIHIYKGVVSLPGETQIPIRGASWGEHKWEYTLERLMGIPSTLNLDIDGSSRDPKDDYVEATYPTFSDGLSTGWRDVNYLTDEWVIVEKAGKKQFCWKVPRLVAKLQSLGFPKTEKVQVTYKFKK